MEEDWNTTKIHNALYEFGFRYLGCVSYDGLGWELSYQYKNNSAVKFDLRQMIREKYFTFMGAGQTLFERHARFTPSSPPSPLLSSPLFSSPLFPLPHPFWCRWEGHYHIIPADFDGIPVGVPDDVERFLLFLLLISISFSFSQPFPSRQLSSCFRFAHRIFLLSAHSAASKVSLLKVPRHRVWKQLRGARRQLLVDDWRPQPCLWTAPMGPRYLPSLPPSLPLILPELTSSPPSSFSFPPSYSSSLTPSLHSPPSLRSLPPCLLLFNLKLSLGLEINNRDFCTLRGGGYRMKNPPKPKKKGEYEGPLP